MKRFFILAILLLSSVTLAIAEIPNTIHFQGRLTSTTGTPVTDASYGITFQLWDAETSGTMVWSGSYTVYTKSGYYNTELGAGASPFGPAMTFDDQYYLDMQVAGDPSVLAPRIKVNSVAYAIRARSAVEANSATVAATANHALSADSATNASNAWQLGLVQASDYLTKNTNSVTSADIAAGAVDTQAKAPWAPVVQNGISNPKIASGTGVSDANGVVTVDISSFGFVNPPVIYCTGVVLAVDDCIIINLDNSTTKDAFTARTWYQQSGDMVRAGPVWFYWLAVGN